MPLVRKLRQIEHRLADIAAKNRIEAGSRQNVMRKRGCGGFAVCACDRNHFCVCTRGSPLAHEDFGIADDLRTVSAGQLYRPMRLGMRERHARSQHQRIDPAPVRLFEVAKRQSGSLRSLPSALAIVPDQNRGPASEQRARRRQTRHPHAEDGNGLSSECAGFDHVTSI